MKKQLFFVVLMLGLGSLIWGAQGPKADLFDLKKSQQELEVMKGILGTTISYASSELQNAGDSKQEKPKVMYRFAGMGINISAYYLYGQGATFVIPMSSFHYGSAGIGKFGALYAAPKIATTYKLDLDDSLRQVEEQMHALNLEMAVRNEELSSASREAAEAAQELSHEMAMEYAQDTMAHAVAAAHAGIAAGVGSGQGSGQGQQVAPPPEPPAPPKPPKAKVDKEEIRKKVEEAQAKAKQAREEMFARQKKLVESISQISVYLVEALANYGDSLTHVRPNEYINIIITTDDGFALFGDGGEGHNRRNVISVQKSIITDYKAGRLTLDAFRQKVLQYGT